MSQCGHLKWLPVCSPCNYHPNLITERLVLPSPERNPVPTKSRAPAPPILATSGHQSKVWLYRSAYSGHFRRVEPVPCGLAGLACSLGEKVSGFAHVAAPPALRPFLSLSKTPPATASPFTHSLTDRARPGWLPVSAGCGEQRSDELPGRAFAGSLRNCVDRFGDTPKLPPSMTRDTSNPTASLPTLVTVPLSPFRLKPVTWRRSARLWGLGCIATG